MTELLSIFQFGEESFFDLLRDPNHLAFEAVTGILQTIVIDVVLLAFVWPVVKRHIHRDVDSVACAGDRIDSEEA